MVLEHERKRGIREQGTSTNAKEAAPSGEDKATETAALTDRKKNKIKQESNPQKAYTVFDKLKRTQTARGSRANPKVSSSALEVLRNAARAKEVEAA